MTLYKWSQIAASNATADGLINWQENQAPSSVNDSARQMMAAIAKYRDDVSGAIVTGGTSTAYTVASFETFDTLAHLGGQTIAFTPHITNGATVTLNVDSLGAKPLRSSPGVELAANSLILGTPYVAVYNNNDAVWYLHGGAGSANAYSIPLGAGLDYWGSTAPNSIFAFPAGQAISRASYAALFSLIGTTYGAGDGSSTFNLPNKAGRVSAMKESAATLLTTGGGGIDGATLGATSSAQNVTLAAVNIPSLTSSGNNNIAVTPTGGFYSLKAANSTLTDFNPTAAAGFRAPGNTASMDNTANFSGSNSITVTYTNASPTATKVVQPTIICNYIMRVL